MAKVILSVDPEDPPSKQAIAKAALARFVHRGVEATSIRDLADETGYTNPALYKFWDGKDALVLDVFERCYRQLVRHLEGAWSDDAPPLRAFLLRYLAAVDDDLDAVLSSRSSCGRNGRAPPRQRDGSRSSRSSSGSFPTTHRRRSSSSPRSSA